MPPASKCGGDFCATVLNQGGDMLQTLRWRGKEKESEIKRERERDETQRRDMPERFPLGSAATPISSPCHPAVIETGSR